MKRKPKSNKPKALPDPGRAIVLVNPPPDKHKGGRVSFWLTPERIRLFESLLGDGNTYTTACGLLGISEGRFYSYLQTGRAVKGLESFPSTAPIDPKNRELCRELLEAVTRASATAMARAVETVKQAIEGAKAGERTTVTFTETIMRGGLPVLDKDGNPQLYERITVTEKVITLAPDARIALEVLARRDPEHWAKNKNAEPEPFELEVVGMIKAGQVEYETLLEQFPNEETMILHWFETAGVTPVIKKG